ncbi:uncharacterized protein A4U43_C03F23020 [Asparagus officinalis]|uniref:Uncharacterized protein n=1 Tax=Asparagus officinalis TaxID=4686 RepID=A0A5P1FD37_ASPOF|nr:uncharacterized protein LOC109834267 [Asparagus officinalis]ONK76022.1 uncharacterized protein A4U43_C03F23020 [Asparagus officinalis]
MGIWDAVSSTADSLRNRLPDPEPVKNAGRSAYSAVANRLTGEVPDLRTPVVGILRSSYNHSCSAFSSVDGAVRVKGFQRVRESMPDKEVLARIGWNLTDFAFDKYTRSITGGLPVYRTIVDGLRNKDAKTTQKINTEQELQALQSRMERLEAILSAKDSQPLAHPHCYFVRPHQKPEDVIRIFMMKGFTGGDLLNGQVMLQHENWKRDALLCPILSSKEVH